MRKKLFTGMLVLLLAFVFLSTACFAAVASKAHKEPPPPPPPPPAQRDAIAVGSFNAYWGLNDWYMGLLKQYFTLDQMKSIDQQIQAITGITNYSYNYNGEGGTGYYYDGNGNWNYRGGRAGKHYNELYDKGFLIDIETATVVTTFSSRGWTGGGNYANTLPGKQVNVNGQNYNIVGARNWSPIILDLDNDGAVDTNRNIWVPHAPKFFSERTAHFDLTGDDRVEFCEWLGGKDGLLVKPNEDGTVTNANNLFGTAGGYRDGYEKMSIILDKDNNGWVEGEELEGLYVWQDKNSNAVCEKEELSTVQSHNVTKISTSHKNFKSTYFKGNEQCKTWDWWPTGFEVIKRK